AGEVDHVHVLEIGAGLDERRTAAVDDGDASAGSLEIGPPGGPDRGRTVLRTAGPHGVRPLRDLLQGRGIVGGAQWRGGSVGFRRRGLDLRHGGLLTVLYTRLCHTAARTRSQLPGFASNFRLPAAKVPAR